MITVILFYPYHDYNLYLNKFSTILFDLKIKEDKLDEVCDVTKDMTNRKETVC